MSAQVGASLLKLRKAYWLEPGTLPVSCCAAIWMLVESAAWSAKMGTSPAREVEAPMLVSGVFAQARSMVFEASALVLASRTNLGMR